MEHTLYYIIGIYLLVLVGSRVVVLQRLLGLRMRHVDYTLSQFDDLPEDLQLLFKAEAGRLEALGFSVLHTQLSRSLFRHIESEKWSLVMVNRESGVCAEILFSSTLLNMPGTEVQFYSFAKDGRILCTLRTHNQSLLVKSNELSMFDVDATDTQEQYQHHLQRASEWLQQSRPIVPDQPNYLVLRRKTDNLFFEDLVRNKNLLPAGGESYRLSLRAAFRLSSDMMKANKQSRKRRQQQANNTPPPDRNKPADENIPLAADVRAYKYVTAFNERRSTGMLGRSIAFIATLVVSYFAFGLIFSYKTVAILLGVVLFHELGHLLAMLVYGYRNLRILFIPLLGGVAIGNKDEVAAWKQVIVYLMGPLPGIILGLVLLTFKPDAHSPWLYETTMLLLFINYLNLLPVLPLDGGHILRLTLLERFPTTLLLFTVVSALLFLAGAVFTRDPIFWFLALVMLLTIPNSLKRSRLLKTLGKKPASPGEESTDGRLLRAFARLRESPFDTLRFVQKYRLVKSINDFLMQNRHCSLPAAFGMLAIYLSVLLLTPVAAVYSIYGSQATQVISGLMGHRPQALNWDERIASSSEPRQRMKAQINAAYSYISKRDYARAEAYLKQAERTAARLNTPGDAAKVREAYAYYYKWQGRHKQFLQNLQAAIKLRESDIPGHEYALSQNYLVLSDEKFSRHDLAGYESALKHALDYAYRIPATVDRRYLGPGQARLIRDKLQDFYYRQREPGKAQSLLRESLAILADASDYPSKLATQSVYEDLGWWAVEGGRPQQALTYFKQALAVIDQADSLTDAKNKLPQVSRSMAIRPNLELAYVYYQQNQLHFARQYIDKAARLVESVSHTSLEKYLAATRGAGDEDVSMDSPRLVDHWRLLRECYRKTKALI